MGRPYSAGADALRQSRFRDSIDPQPWAKAAIKPNNGSTSLSFVQTVLILHRVAAIVVVCIRRGIDYAPAIPLKPGAASRLGWTDYSRQCRGNRARSRGSRILLRSRARRCPLLLARIRDVDIARISRAPAVYIEALERRIHKPADWNTCGKLASPFLLRTATPALESVDGKTVQQIRRVGKRIAIGLDGDLWLVLHLMIAGRLHWSKPGVSVAPKRALAAFDFEHGSLLLTEAGTQRRASLHVVEGEDGLHALDPGGLDVLTADLVTFTARLISANHTLKRALTDPRLFSGIGNAYSDEILHRAQSFRPWRSQRGLNRMKLRVSLNRRSA